MRVNDAALQSTAAGQVSKAQDGYGKARVGVRYGGEVSDRVTLSGLSEAATALRPDSEVRQARVAELERLYSQGLYRTDARSTGSSLLRYELGTT